MMRGVPVILEGRKRSCLCHPISAFANFLHTKSWIRTSLHGSKSLALCGRSGAVEGPECSPNSFEGSSRVSARPVSKLNRNITKIGEKQRWFESGQRVLTPERISNVRTKIQLQCQKRPSLFL